MSSKAHNAGSKFFRGEGVRFPYESPPCIRGCLGGEKCYVDSVYTRLHWSVGVFGGWVGLSERGKVGATVRRAAFSSHRAVLASRKEDNYC